MGKTTDKHAHTAPATIDLAPAVQTLGDLKTALGPVREVLRREELDAVSAGVFVQLGKRAASADIIATVPSFVVEAKKAWDALARTDRPKLVGFTAAFLPLLVDEALRLESVYRKFVAQDAGVVHEVGKRRRALSDAISEGVTLRDQCARALRRRMRGDDAAIAALESATGTADEPARLAAGLNLLAQTLTATRAAASDERRGLFDELGLTADYAAALRAQALAVEAAESAANAAATTIVTQDDLDQQDGRVLHLIDCVHRAFKDAAPRLAGLAVPPLGSVESAIAPRARSAKPAAGDGNGATDPTATAPG